MNVYACFPSAKVEKAKLCRDNWRRMGYKIGIYFDKGAEQCEADLVLSGKYQGYPLAANKLAQYAVLVKDADIVVLLGDDMTPDPNLTAEQIGKEFMEHFSDGFGVMQPTGDLQGIDDSGRCAAARICGSGWYGRAWIERAYQGMGPVWSNYYHYYYDEEVQIVAQRLGVYWQRPDLTQQHYHWSWGHTRRETYHEQAQTHWAKDQAMFGLRNSQGFPFSEPLK